MEREEPRYEDPREELRAPLFPPSEMSPAPKEEEPKKPEGGVVIIIDL